MRLENLQLNDKSNYVYHVKYTTTYTKLLQHYISDGGKILKKVLKGAYFH